MMIYELYYIEVDSLLADVMVIQLDN